MLYERDPVPSILTRRNVLPWPPIPSGCSSCFCLSDPSSPSLPARMTYPRTDPTHGPTRETLRALLPPVCEIHETCINNWKTVVTLWLEKKKILHWVSTYNDNKHVQGINSLQPECSFWSELAVNGTQGARVILIITLSRFWKKRNIQFPLGTLPAPLLHSTYLWVRLGHFRPTDNVCMGMVVLSDPLYVSIKSFRYAIQSQIDLCGSSRTFWPHKIIDGTNGLYDNHTELFILNLY